ncbi:MAG: UDP-N-acetylmuramate:L-alanyl-gamma-D-glutamyl-meso-diaminopimelate ligase [Zetaproteobacteria bacterium CG12_big_fil_rev_8_21_14_0_65_55_1124]|nr:MAG: UDP-N-acetylmuramate:L-alanyl-gamma-D-glutamyl-meso-diaminopimelate ligase [Zetaproteobacteria bacterium CG1_02_55_237]PIS19429.1 MAG: UDP-N-acetylmuramate:L-alanyl-gamma-D-glutamyl-meso-diaminopimelate ligase [Zetaproteobacteria bacterium CG08_land_8_20_14_0_20_55_17]PIW42999.1 MAG: UDP-N-acetylmuramate:L-alanyl-gamma-D-glutamyl-meso-diaminopimelate ligase [Zetaproteobacteria bacterium CG12_big_fil_rev_8_21_14_0_65_55_1124]PIY51540.1 MAG: UDP-N-acetylmuramate:L-alanyl-gamma-D-glutamyl-m
MSKHIHILGICGTAMAAIAALAREQGYRVSGSDAGIYPPMSDYLRDLGIAIAPFDAANLEPVPDLAVIGNALSRGNVEVEAVLNAGIPYTSGAQFIGDHILSGRHGVVVAGTHGKTTSASLMAHVLQTAGRKPGFMIGGIPEDFGGGARLGEGEHVVLEGDEYDTAFFDKRSKFLHYHARTLILNNLEYDHADIFPNLEAIKLQFHHLLRTVPANGHIIVNADDENLADVLSRGCWAPCTFFARLGHASADWHWEALKNDGTAFRLYRDGEPVIETSWGMIGVHNVANACAVAAAACDLGVSLTQISEAFTTFSGVRRRMTLSGTARGIRIFDDFAHHPTAITGIVSAAKAAMKSDGKLWVIVEPRSNTMRTRIHEKRLPLCFDAADGVIFSQPSSRNLAPDEVLDAQGVCATIGPHAQVLPDAAAIIDYLAKHAATGDDILILSNGGFDGIHKHLLEKLGQIT